MVNQRPQRYRVSAADKRPLLAMVSEGLRAGGATILKEPDPSVAPFEYEILTPKDERLRLAAYLFRANKYGQRKRPENEHRFQIKYGSDFDVYHFLALPDPRDRSTVTLFLGVHLEEGILVGCDPAMHNPTWFSKSVEFKDEQVELAQKRGWYAWERDRRDRGRRKEPLPLLDYRIETVVAFTPKSLLRYIDLERVATGLDPGERLLLAQTPPGKRRHALEIELGLTHGEILDMIERAFRLKVAARGAAAQLHLGKKLEKIPGLTVVPIDEDARPDFEVRYRSRRRPLTIECKNVLRSHRFQGLPIVEYQKTRASKGDPLCGRYYTFRHCDILAACLHPITEQWDYEYCPSRELPPHARCPGKVHPRVPVGGEDWTRSIERLIDELTGGR
jgi:hypothetical protein